AAADEESVGGDEKGIGALARKGRKGRIDLADRCCVEEIDLQPEGAGGFLRFTHCRLGGGSISRIDEYCNANRLRHQLMQEPQPLGDHFLGKKLIPVALPPGRARLVTRPSLTGSSPAPNTIGIVAVAALAASAANGVPGVAIAATRRRTKS